MTIATDDIIDIRDIIKRVEELREQSSEKYLAGFNVPGYMPDNPPEEFYDAGDARAYIAEQMRVWAESLDDPDDTGLADSLVRNADALEAAATEQGDAEYGKTVGSYHYWIRYEGGDLDADDTEELATLETLLSELAGGGGDEEWEGDWYPLTLIRDDYFPTYAQELAEDIGAIPADVSWPCNCIDWGEAASELQQDYNLVTFGDTDYWYR